MAIPVIFVQPKSQIFVIGDIDMKKVLLGTAALAVAATFVAAPAFAQVKLGVGGHTKLYGSWLDQDTQSDDTATVGDQSLEVRSLDILRETELHFTGETTLDNGLTVGSHIEVDVDGTDSSFNIADDAEEAYAYFSGAWGRVNFGREDGAAYLLQVSAPSADSNHDGIRQWVAGTNYNLFDNDAATTGENVSLDELFSTGLVLNDVVVDIDGNNAAINAGATGDIFVGANGAGIVANSRFDYDQAISGFHDKFTYMTPVFNGFQAGFSYSPDIAPTNPGARDFGNNQDDQVGDYGDVFDVAARYEGQFDQVGIALGGGWTHAELEADDGVPILYQSAGQQAGGNAAGFTAGFDQIVATLDDREAWNVGIDFDWMAFGLGGAYMEDDNGVSGDNFETETWTVGLDYTTGPFKLGGTYYSVDQNVGGSELEVDRYTGGVVYTYGPGMTFRGSVSWIDHEEAVGFEGTSADSTNVLLGTQIDF
jgi:hypothetical protein